MSDSENETMSVTKSPSGPKWYLSTDNPFEKKFGYHRAVRKGPFIYVSGTTAIDPETGKIESPDDAFLQAYATLETVEEAVKELGGEREDVVRVRMFVAVSHVLLVVDEGVFDR
jgi:enamine deaminase RidA (YjgF/YER057c/UK114 family)